jgi:hypothetical protein
MQMDELIAAVEIGRPASDWELLFAHRAAPPMFISPKRWSGYVCPMKGSTGHPKDREIGKSSRSTRSGGADNRRPDQ